MVTSTSLRSCIPHILKGMIILLIYQPDRKFNVYKVIPYRITWNRPETQEGEELLPAGVEVSLSSDKELTLTNIINQHGEEVVTSIERLYLPSEEQVVEEGVQNVVVSEEVEQRLNRIQGMRTVMVDANPYVEFGILPTRRNHTLKEIEAEMEKEKTEFLGRNVIELELENFRLKKRVDELEELLQ